MSRSNKYLKLHQDVLLEWIYDTENLISETYQVVQNLSTDRRGYISQLGLNKFENTVFPIDEVIKKYAKVDGSKYNFLKFETYSIPYTQFDKLRIYLPTSYSFSDSGYIGLYVRVWTYDYTNKKQIDLSSYLYDDTVSNQDLNLNEDFYFDEQVWGKYLTYNLPSLDYVSKQRTSTVSTDLPINNTINYNLTKGIGLSQTSPIFIDFSFVVSRQVILGNTYYFFSDKFTKSITPIPEYADLAVTIEESSNGDYFEIWGSYSESNESLDDFIDELNAKGRTVKIEYEVSRFEENILMDSQVFTVTENFSKKLKYRPIIEFSNTTAAIDVEMRVIDLVDNSVISRYASIGLTSNLFKYGPKLTQINLSGAFKPKIYNSKSSNKSTGLYVENYIPDINLTKVPYPIVVDRIKLLVNTSPGSLSNSMTNGYGGIIFISEYDSYVKFEIASDINNAGTATPYDLIPLTENSKIYLSFKSDQATLEIPVFEAPEQNNYKNGVIFFKVSENDVRTLKKISEDNQRYSLIVRSNTGNAWVLYEGTWQLTSKTNFSSETISLPPVSNVGDFLPQDISTTNPISTPTPLTTTTTSTISNPSVEITTTPVASTPQSTNTNAMIFVNSNANITNFESYLTSNKINVFKKTPCGNSKSLVYVYFVTNITVGQFQALKNLKAKTTTGKGISTAPTGKGTQTTQTLPVGTVTEIYQVPFNVGLNETGKEITTTQSIDNSKITAPKGKGTQTISRGKG